MARGVSWKEHAAALGARIPPSDLHPKALAQLEDPGRRRWGIALSGGADSVCLLLLLWQHFPARRRSWVVLHFNHRLRGAASDRDAQFCQALAKGLGLAYVSATWRKATKAGGEAAARSARFAFFESACRTRRIDTLVFGHQQDDVAESILMRLARGSSAGGLAAPRPAHRQDSGRVHVRPLLTLRKAAIEEMLRAESIPWRKDATNAAPTFFRNRVRAEVIPAWQQAAGRDAVAGAALSRERLEEDDEALEAWVDRLDVLTPRGALRLTALAGAPRAVARRALHRWLLNQAPAADISRQAFELLLASVIAGKPTRHSLGRQGFAVLAKGRLNYVLGPI